MAMVLKIKRKVKWGNPFSSRHKNFGLKSICRLITLILTIESAVLPGYAHSSEKRHVIGVLRLTENLANSDIQLQYQGEKIVSRLKKSFEIVSLGTRVIDKKDRIPVSSSEDVLRDVLEDYAAFRDDTNKTINRLQAFSRLYNKKSPDSLEEAKILLNAVMFESLLLWRSGRNQESCNAVKNIIMIVPDEFLKWDSYPDSFHKFILSCHAKSAHGKMSEVIISSKSKVAVLIEGLPVGNTPLTLYLPDGTYHVQWMAADYKDSQPIEVTNSEKPKKFRLYSPRRKVNKPAEFYKNITVPVSDHELTRMVHKSEKNLSGIVVLHTVDKKLNVHFVRNQTWKTFLPDQHELISNKIMAILLYGNRQKNEIKKPIIRQPLLWLAGGVAVAVGVTVAIVFSSTGGSPGDTGGIALEF